MNQLESWREAIDRIDRTIVDSINERYKLVQKIGDWKKANHLPVYVPEREASLLARLREENKGPMPDETLLAIYAEIISGSRRLERPLSVACLGPEGTFSCEAARRKFGHGAELRPVNLIPDVFREVEADRADYGCVPVENSIEGVVNPTLDALRETPLSIVAEWYLPIHHLLLSQSKPAEIQCIYSHPQALGQCRKYLAANFPKVTLIEVTSTTRAAELASREPGSAAIAGVAAAEKFKLPILEENVEDDPTNTTRFLAVAPQGTRPTGHDKTSFCFMLKDRSGALYDALAPLREAKLSMTLIESRPLHAGQWEYCFFADILGHREDENVKTAFAAFAEQCAAFKIFGSYPNALPTREAICAVL